MGGIRAVEGVDNTLVNIAADAVSTLTPKPAITLGPLDRDDDLLRLNWFLYAVSPNTAYRNMEPPQTGTRTARGNPPLALELDYVLTAHPGPLTATGQEAQFAHRGLIAVMQAIHAQGIIGEDSPLLAPEAAPLVEPLRLTHASMDLDGLSKLWTSVSQPMRTTVGYRVSLAVVDSKQVHVPGPPVRERRFAVVPSMGARFGTITPSRTSAGSDITVELSGAAGHLTFTLGREAGDPPGLGDWVLTATQTGTSEFTLTGITADLAPGVRRLAVIGQVEGLPAGGDSAALTLVPVIISVPAGQIAAGAPLSLTTAHVNKDVEVVFDGVVLPAPDVTFVPPAKVDIIVPATAAAGPRPVSLRSARTAGPTFDGIVVA